MFDKFNFSDPVSLIVSAVIVIYIFFEVYAGWKKGFFESSIRFLGVILAVIGAYLLKDSVSVLMYTHLPFFEFGGLFKGVSSLNIILYELIAFVAVFILLMLVVKIICKITGLIDKIMSLVFFLGIPNKILGGLVGFVQALVFLYFVIFGVKVVGNLVGMEMRPSLADVVVELPVLNNTFGDILSSLDDITALATEYENTKDKDEFNNKAIEILLEYEIITEDNLKLLIESGKIDSMDSITDFGKKVEESNNVK